MNEIESTQFAREYQRRKRQELKRIEFMRKADYVVYGFVAVAFLYFAIRVWFSV